MLNVELVLNVHFPEWQYTDNIRYFTIYCLFIILLFKRLTDNGQIVCIFLTDRKLIIKLARWGSCYIHHKSAQHFGIPTMASTCVSYFLYRHIRIFFKRGQQIVLCPVLASWVRLMKIKFFGKFAVRIKLRWTFESTLSCEFQYNISRIFCKFCIEYPGPDMLRKFI